MHFPTLQSVALLVLAGANVVLAAPAPAPAAADASTSGSGSHSCSQLLVRKEWRKLSKSDRLSFISAVKCLMRKPPKTSGIYQGVKTRFDDFQALHIASTDYIHFNGPFLAWHRWMLHLYELDLRSTCGYKGALPYWDFSLDNTMESFPRSPLFDPTYGFGGNGPYIADVSDPILFPVKTPTIIPGRTGGGCVDNGPFKNLTVPMGVGNSTAYNPHCLRRDFSPTLVSTTLSNANIQAAKDAPTYFDFSIRIQGTSFDVSGLYLHAGLHLGIGGQVGEAADTWSSPGDPLFYFIHAALDKFWNDWQRASWSTRKAEIAGPDTNFAYPFNFFGDIPYKNITLDYSMAFPNFGSNVKISEVMDIQASKLCYTYA